MKTASQIAADLYADAQFRYQASQCNFSSHGNFEQTKRALAAQAGVTLNHAAVAPGVVTLNPAAVAPGVVTLNTRRGRPVTGTALTSSERQAAYRLRRSLAGDL